MSPEGPPARSTRAARQRHLRETSYGGVVVRRNPADGSFELLTIVPRGTRFVGLPKGGANPGERPEETAAREVREETGTTVTVIEPLGHVSYWYRPRGRRTHKTVHFFLCHYVSGSTDDHDHEVESAMWIPLEDAPLQLTYPAERRLARLALSKVRRDR